MKQLLASLGLVLLLTACGGDDASTSDSDANPLYFTYSSADFEIDVPDDWETLNAFTAEYPEEVRVVFRNNVKDSDFIANVTIIREENSKGFGTLDYAQDKVNDHRQTLLNYEMLSQEQVSTTLMGSEHQTLLNTFQGKNSSSGDTLQFKQIYLAAGEYTWTATGSYRPSEDEFVIERIDTMLKSFTLN